MTLDIERLKAVLAAAHPPDWWPSEDDGSICSGPDGPEAEIIGDRILDPSIPGRQQSRKSA